MADAEWALVGVVVGAIATGLMNLIAQRKRFKHERDLLSLRHKSEEVVKEILSDKLNHQSHIERSFSALRAPIGGFTDDEIRKLLHELDAQKLFREDGSEWWYLRSRKDARLAARYAKSTNTASPDVQ